MPVYTLLNNAQSAVTGSALDCTGVQKAAFFIVGDFDGEVVFEATPDNSRWLIYDGRLVGGQRVDRILAPNRAVYFDVEPVQAIRPRITRINKGSVTVYAYAEVTKGEADSYAHINAVGGTLVKSGSGKLRAVVVNDPGSDMVVTLYDNTSAAAPVIATIKSGVADSLSYGLKFNTGLYVNVSATTVGDITIIYE